MPATDWSVEEHGDIAQAVARLAAIPGKVTHWSRETLERAADKGSDVMIRDAPSSKGKNDPFPRPDLMKEPSNKHYSLKARVRLQQQRAKAVYSPGGAGGGGRWEIKFGPVELPWFQGSPEKDPAYILLHGSGMKSDRGGHKIEPGKLMTWMDGSEQVFARSSVGQRPQRRWFDRGSLMAQNVIRGRVQSLNL